LNQFTACNRSQLGKFQLRYNRRARDFDRDSYANEKVLDMKSNYVFETVDELMKFLEENI
jgi:hypothetical protein